MTKKTCGSIFRARLRGVRDLRHMSQDELAVKCDLKPCAISHFETGQRLPSFRNLIKLAKALNVTSDYLLGLTQSPTNSITAVDKILRDINYCPHYKRKETEDETPNPT